MVEFFGTSSPLVWVATLPFFQAGHYSIVWSTTRWMKPGLIQFRKMRMKSDHINLHQKKMYKNRRCHFIIVAVKIKITKESHQGLSCKCQIIFKLFKQNLKRNKISNRRKWSQKLSAVSAI